MKTRLKNVMIVLSSIGLVAAVSIVAIGAGKSVVVAKADLKWKEMGIPGVMAAQVSGDMQKGASRFFLKYPVGLVTPNHHHTADHYVAVVSGTVPLTVDGKEHRLGPGSYFALTGKMPHIAKVGQRRARPASRTSATTSPGDSMRCAGSGDFSPTGRLRRLVIHAPSQPGRT